MFKPYMLIQIPYCGRRKRRRMGIRKRIWVRVQHSPEGLRSRWEGREWKGKKSKNLKKIVTAAPRVGFLFRSRKLPRPTITILFFSEVRCTEKGTIIIIIFFCCNKRDVEQKLFIYFSFHFLPPNVL